MAYSRARLYVCTFALYLCSLFCKVLLFFIHFSLLQNFYSIPNHFCRSRRHPYGSYQKVEQLKQRKRLVGFVVGYLKKMLLKNFIPFNEIVSFQNHAAFVLKRIKNVFIHRQLCRTNSLNLSEKERSNLYLLFLLLW